MPKKHKDIPIRKLYMICTVVTVLALVLICLLLLHGSRMSSPIYELTVKGLSAETPQEAQMICRADSAYYSSMSASHSNCCWVWTCDDKLYLVPCSDLRVDAGTSRSTGYTRVDFSYMKGIRLSGYIIDPTVEPREIARVNITNSINPGLSNVGMSVREGIRNGLLTYENAVYVWESGQSFVYVLREDAVTKVIGNVCTFTDDGDEFHTGFLLDTKV